MIADVYQDLLFGARMLGKSPGFTSVVVLTLALGIGANTTIFSLLNSLVLKPLPGIARPEQLVQIGQTYNGQGFNSSSYADYRDYRDQNSTFEGIAAQSESQPPCSSSQLLSLRVGFRLDGPLGSIRSSHCVAINAPRRYSPRSA